MLRSLAFLPLVLLASSTLASAQQPSPATIRVTSHIVYVDVIVRDRDGHIVHGLTQQDFKLEEDGKPQQIDFFTAHSYDMAAAQRDQQLHPRPEPALQPVSGKPAALNFSNIPLTEQAGAVNIILFDLMNTPQQDQLAAHKQLVHFLEALPTGQQVALFVLTNRLQMIQNFTGSSDRLIEAARNLSPKDYGLILSKAAAMQGADSAAEFALQSGPNPSGNNAIQSQNVSNSGADSATRADRTVVAFTELAHALNGYPGRKNLLWLSESFPIALGEQLDQTRYLGLSTVPHAREAANMIAASQIAVYPISLLGLETSGVGSDAPGTAGVSLFTGAGATLRNQFTARQALRTQMNNIAYETGGEAFAGTNDFAEALRRSMDDGSNFYTLAYRPQNQRWNGQFRKLHVELAPKRDSLSYRQGYFAYADSSAPPDSAKELIAALRPEMPQSTMLVLKSTLQPSHIPAPGTAHPDLRIDSTLDPRSIGFTTDAAGHRHAQILVLLVAFADSAQTEKANAAAPVPQTSGVLSLDLTPEQYQIVLAKGIPFQQSLPLKPGRYRLRLGVSDTGSHRIGTLDMPLDLASPPPA